MSRMSEDGEMSKCKNCGHEIFSFSLYDEKPKWKHTSYKSTEEDDVCVMKGTTICLWRDERECPTCKDISFSNPCKCENAEPEEKK